MTIDKGVIIRPAVSREYVSLPNAILSDRRLSLDTRGMLCFILSKSKNFEIRPWALAKALSTDGAKLGRTKLDRMFREATAAGYVARSEKQGRKDDGSFSRFAYIVGMPDDVAAEVERLSVASLPHARNPHTGDPHTGDPHTGNVHTLSTKYGPNEKTDHTNHQHHQFGHPPVDLCAEGEKRSSDEGSYSRIGQHAKANGMVFVYVGSKPYQAWRAFRGDDGMPFVDVAVINGIARRGSWFPSIYPRRGAA